MIIPNDSFVGTHYIGKQEKKAVKNVLNNKTLFRYDGVKTPYKTDEFEKKMAEHLQVKYVLACSNGTAALKLCCIANGIGVGDEVIMSPFTFISSAGSVLSCGAIPIFVDIDETMNIDVQQIEKSITNKTKAIMAIHMQGQPCNMKKIKEIAEKHNLIVIEDAAQAFGSKIGNAEIGSFGDCSAFSLQAGKTITCGEGGFFVTNNEELYEKAKMYHDNGGYRLGSDYPTWENGKTIFGENFKITELQSAIATEQLKKIKLILKNQTKKYNYIVEKMDKDFYKLRPNIENNTNVNTNISIIFDSDKECTEFIVFMNSNNIGFNIYCSNLVNNFDTIKYGQSWHTSGFPYNFTKEQSNKCEFSQKLFRRVAFLNLSASLKKKHLKYISKKLEEYKCEKCK